jgi:glycosyltransferase involved in cell wall biosynthesis
VKDNESSLLFSPGDHAYLAFQIKRIFSDDALAEKIGREARMIAQKRHHIEHTIRQYMSIYSNIIDHHHENIACAL